MRSSRLIDYTCDIEAYQKQYGCKGCDIPGQRDICIAKWITLAEAGHPGHNCPWPDPKNHTRAERKARREEQ